MDIATESERIIRLKEVISIERGLLEVGFVAVPPTSLLYWECCGLRIDACEDWTYGWYFIATAVTPRIALFDELKLPPQMPGDGTHHGVSQQHLSAYWGLCRPTGC